MSEHTKAPWEHCGINGVHKRVSSHYATCVATTVGDDREANARHIVHCVNNHERLVEALRNTLRVLDGEDGTYSINRDRKLLAQLEAEKGGDL